MSKESEEPFDDPDNYGDGWHIRNSNVKITHTLSLQVVVIIAVLVVLLIAVAVFVGRADARMAQLEDTVTQKAAETQAALRDEKVSEDLRKFAMEEARIGAAIASGIQQANLAATKCRQSM